MVNEEGVLSFPLFFHLDLIPSVIAGNALLIDCDPKQETVLKEIFRFYFKVKIQS